MTSPISLPRRVFHCYSRSRLRAFGYRGSLLNLENLWSPQGRSFARTFSYSNGSPFVMAVSSLHIDHQANLRRWSTIAGLVLLAEVLVLFGMISWVWIGDWYRRPRLKVQGQAKHRWCKGLRRRLRGRHLV